MNKNWFIIAAVLFIVTAICSVGHHQGDEHFQILEFAAMKAGLASPTDLTWEYHAQMRPALQPAMAYSLLRAGEWFGAGNPFHLTLLLRLLSAGFTLVVIWGLYVRYQPRFIGQAARYWPALLLLHWCLYYNGVRFSSENWGGLAAIAGVLCYPIYGTLHKSFTPAGGKSALLAGVCFGLSFLFRYQMALFIGGFYLWQLVYQPRHWKPLLRSIAAGLGTLLICYPLSFWLYGEWTLPAWNYFAQNLVEGKAAGYGTLPWWGYFELVFLRGIPPLGLLYVLATLGYLYHYRRDPLSWAVGFFIVVHSLIGRKDIRFLFPLIPLLPVLLTGGWEAIRPRLDQKAIRYVARPLVWISIGLNFVLLAAVMLRPAASEIAPLRFLYTAYPDGATLTGPQARIVQAEGATARFYHRPSVRIAPSDSLAFFSCAPAPCLYLDRTRDRPDPPPGAELVYTDRPDRLLRLVPFRLLDREKWWYIYRID